MPRKMNTNNSGIESMTLKRKLNAHAAEKYRKNKVEAYNSALEAIKKQQHLHQETIDLANRILLDLAKAVGMMKKDYEIKREIWPFEDEYNMNNFHKMISELNFKQRRILEEVDKMKIPLKRGSETKIEDEDHSLVVKTEIPIKNSTPDYQPVQYSPIGTWPERDMYKSNQTNSNDYNNVWYNSMNHSPCESSQNFIQSYENINSCSSLASSSSLSDTNFDYNMYDDLDSIDFQDLICFKNC